MVLLAILLPLKNEPGPSGRSTTLNTRESILRYFSTCPLCGHFLASLLALLGDDSFDNAIQQSAGIWLRFPWQPPIADMLNTYYGWRFEPGVGEQSGRCPSCLRRIVYLPDAAAEGEGDQISILQLERRPGARV
jgi:hypothetical protein